jgi:hypothetical protein
MAADDLGNSGHRFRRSGDHHFARDNLQTQTHSAGSARFAVGFRRAIQRLKIRSNSGSAEIIELPNAIDILIYWYRQVRGEHKNWDEYREQMRQEQRVIIRVNIQKVGPRHPRQR